MTDTPIPPRDRKALIELSGLDYMRAMLEGRIPYPPIWGLMNFTLTQVAPGEVRFHAAARPEHGNVTGIVHGGWYGTLLDAAMGCAAMTTIPAGASHTTLEYKVNITRPVPIGLQVEAFGRIQHAGRSTAVAMGEIRGVDDARVYGTGSTTCIVLQPK